MPAGNPEAYADMDLEAALGGAGGGDLMAGGGAAPEGDLFGGLGEPGDPGLALGEAGSDEELDPLFQADASTLFPDFDDDKLLALQRLIDSRMGGSAMPLE